MKIIKLNDREAYEIFLALDGQKKRLKDQLEAIKLQYSTNLVSITGDIQESIDTINNILEKLNHHIGE